MGTNLANLLKKGNLPLIMGIVNATPDSFSDGNDSLRPLDKSLKLIDDGADIIDIGGESTKPNASFVDFEEELRRVKFVVKSIRKMRPSSIISIDTRKIEVADCCLDLGADIINDVSNLSYNKEIANSVAKYNAGLILNHSVGTPETMQDNCSYDDLIGEISKSLIDSMNYAMSCGVNKKNIWIDPGIGFGKNMEQNFKILSKIKELSKIAPVLIGHSRKTFIREYLNIDVSDADVGTTAVSIFAMNAGAKILRVHNVKKNVEALEIYKRCKQG